MNALEAQSVPSPNGQHRPMPSRAQLEAELVGEPLTTGYQATLPIDTMWGPDGVPIYQFRRDIEWMLSLPMVKTALSYYKSGIAGAEFWGGANPDKPDDEQGMPISEDKEVSAFVHEQCTRFWDRGVPKLQHGYDYGWVGAENNYTDEDGPMKWSGLDIFAPRDTFLLTRGSIPVGVRVKNVINKGEVDLWLASENIPAKALWYAHDVRYSRYYGQSQVFSAWRPCRRLAWKDGAETVLDGGCYRFAYSGPVIRYPMEDLEGPVGVPYQTQNSQGNPMRYGRDAARQIGQQLKTGASVGLPSTRDDKGNYKWEISYPQQTGGVLGMGPILDVVKYLQEQICYGIGVPPELIKASETGSGYSGRSVPLEAFMSQQQQIADAMLLIFVDQVLKPLVRWNFGETRFNVCVKNLLASRAKSKQGMEGGSQNPGVPGSPPGPPVPTASGAGFSLLITDRIRQIARNALAGQVLAAA